MATNYADLIPLAVARALALVAVKVLEFRPPPQEKA